MKIALATASSVPATTANSIQVVNMASAFHKLGHDVLLLGRLRKGETLNDEIRISEFYGVEDGFSIKRYPWEKARFLSAVNYIISVTYQVLKFRPDLVLSRHIGVSLIAGLAGAPVLHEVHAPELGNSRFGLALTRALLLIPTSLGFVTISRALEVFYRRNLNFGKKLLFSVPDGASLSSHSVPAGNCPRTGVFRAGYFGSLYEGRGFDLILSLADLLPDIQFHIFGDLDFASPELVECAERIQNIKLEGFRPPSVAKQEQKKFDVLLAPYQEATLDRSGNDTAKWMSPLKIFEYMASGAPIVASKLPALEEVLSSGVNCVLVESDDTSAWKEAILLLKHDCEFASTVARRARMDLETNYTWEIRAERILAELGAL